MRQTLYFAILLLFSAVAGRAQDTIRVVSVEREPGTIHVIVENMSGEAWTYALQYSPDLLLGSWVNEDTAVISALENDRLMFELSIEDNAAGYFRVMATPTSDSEPVSVVINEVMTNNDTKLADGAGDFPDWIEFYNTGDTPADLSGYHVSDNDSNLDKWAFPEGAILEPGAYLLVFVSGKKADEIPAGEWHADFKLGNGNEPVILSSPNGDIIDRLSPGPLASDSSMGHARDDLETLYVFDAKESTPGKVNHRFLFGAPDPFIEAPSFVVKGGIYGEPVTVELIAPHGDDVIRYTTDGGEPFHSLFSSNSSLYEGPFVVSEPTVIRAKVFGTPGSRTVTQTYVVGIDHGLPVIAMATEPENFEFTDGFLYGFGNHMFTGSGAIIGTFPYNSSNAWKDREVEASFEVYEPEGGDALSMQAGVKLFGAWGSRGYAQKSFAIYARAEYGYGKIRHAFFPDKDVDAFESIVLRNSGNDNQSTWLTYPRPPIREFSAPASHGSYFVNCNFTMFRDAMMQSLVRETSLDTQSYRPAVLYLNGEYWGIYNIREKFNEHYVESTHGVPTDEVDLIEGYGGANSGSGSTYSQMRSFIGGRPMNDPDNYQTVQERYLDIDNFIDYHLAVIYGQNFDIGNIKCWRPQRDEGGQFHWMLYDQDYSFNLWKPEVYLPAMKRDYSDYDNMFEFYTNPQGSGTGWPNDGGRTLLFRKMLDNDEFKDRCVQRCADLLNSLFSTETVISRIDTMANVIRPEMGRHLTRWSWASIQERGFGIPHKEEDEPLNVEHWERNVEVMRDFARVRPGKLRQDLMDHFKLSNGTADVTISSSDMAKGTVQINTLDLTESPWTGRYFRDFAPTLTAVPVEGARFVGWSGAIESTEATIQLPLESEAVSVTAVFE